MSDFIKNRARPEIFTLKPYIPGKPIEEVRRELGLDDIIKLASNENPLGPSPLAMEAIAAALPDLSMYPDANCYLLKHKLAATLGVDVAEILVGNGSDEILMLLATAFLNRGDRVIYGTPTFSEYESTAKIMGAECLEIPLVDFTYGLEAMLGAVDERTKMVYICNPNNPTGTIVTRQAIQRFMDQVPDEVLVVFDEAYSEYVESPEFISGYRYVKEGHNAIVLRTLSKIYGLAGLRIGYALTTSEIAAAVEMITAPFNINSLAQVGARAALDDKGHLHRSLELNRQGKQYLYQSFDKMGLFYVPTEANFIFLDTGCDCRVVFQSLLTQGVIIRTGDVFGYPRFIRVTIGTAEQNRRFIESLAQVLGK
ncbi:MAG: histidinol-phosphate transaminase [Syntrophomonadaceae bacterium]